MASLALSPARMKSSRSGPKAGSVTFCVATAPTPERACGQRAPTAIEEVAMATPKAPDLAQRAAMEKVMGGFPSVGDDGRHLDLNQPFGAGERGDDEAGRAGKHAFEPAAHF